MFPFLVGFPWWLRGKESAWQCRKYKRCAFNPWVRNIPWRRKWQPIPVLLLGKSHGQKSLVGYSPWGHRVGHRSAQHTHARMHAHMHARTRASSGCNVWTARRQLAIWLWRSGIVLVCLTLKQQTSLSHSCRGWKSEIRDLAWMGSEVLFQTADSQFLLNPYVVESGQGSSLISSFFFFNL